MVYKHVYQVFCQSARADIKSTIFFARMAIKFFWVASYKLSTMLKKLLVEIPDIIPMVSNTGDSCKCINVIYQTLWENL
jgi:hypothetical protein